MRRRKEIKVCWRRDKTRQDTTRQCNESPFLWIILSALHTSYLVFVIGSMSITESHAARFDSIANDLWRFFAIRNKYLIFNNNKKNSQLRGNKSKLVKSERGCGGLFLYQTDASTNIHKRKVHGIAFFYYAHSTNILLEHLSYRFNFVLCLIETDSTRKTTWCHTFHIFTFVGMSKLLFSSFTY